MTDIENRMAAAAITDTAQSPLASNGDDESPVYKILHWLYSSSPVAGPGDDLTVRWEQIKRELATTGTYEHTADELVWLARWSWWTADRCVGRAGWSALEVVDRRDASTFEEVGAACVTHLRTATNRGRIRAMMTVFAPGVRILNEQLIRFAGYREPDGTIRGDRRYVDITARAEALGWRGAGSAFDVLPLLIKMPGHDVEIYEIPSDAARLVPIRHPHDSRIDHLDLSWHAVPVISNMRLRAAGVEYTAAPFNGWYVSDEITRNFIDPDRYGLLESLAEALGHTPGSEDTRWRQRALVDIEHAVYASYKRAGVKISDPDQEARRFVALVDREAAAGRALPTDWSWVISPLAPVLHPTYHRYYPAPLTAHVSRPDPYLYFDTVAGTPSRTGCPFTESV